MKEKVITVCFVIGFFPGFLLLKSLDVHFLLAGMIAGGITGALSAVVGHFLFEKGYIVNIVSVIAFFMSAILSYFVFYLLVFMIDDEPNMYVATLSPILPALIVATLYIKREWKKYKSSTIKDKEM